MAFVQKHTLLTLIFLFSEKFEQFHFLSNSTSSWNCDPSIGVYLWTRFSNPERTEVIKFGSQFDPKVSNFNPRGRTIFYYHGFQSSCWTNVEIRENLTYNMLDLVNAYLTLGVDTNFICIDWRFLAAGNESNYAAIATTSTSIAGRCGAIFADFLSKPLFGWGLDINNTIVHGYSLGAHAAGRMGYFLRQISHGLKKLPHIIGVDPAGPIFGDIIPAVQVNFATVTIHDAYFVQAIHTNAILYGSLLRKMAHINFFLNFGLVQPNCIPSTINRTCNFGLPINKITCNHALAGMYTIETLTIVASSNELQVASVGFWGCKCGVMNCITGCPITPSAPKVLMGPYINLTTRPIYGSYYIQTNACPPFSKGNYVTEQKISWFHEDMNSSEIKELGN